MKKAEYIARKLLAAGQRLGYRNAKGEKQGEQHYDFNLSEIEKLKAELRKSFEDGSWNVEKDWGEELH